jgi:hypothetical protein
VVLLSVCELKLENIILFKNKCIFVYVGLLNIFFYLVKKTRGMIYFYMQKNRVANMSTV